MRSLLAAALLLTSAAPLFAAPALRAPVVVPEIGLKAVINDGRVIVTWRRYKREDFKSYELVKSADAKLEYPETPALFYAEDAGTLSFQDGKLTVGTWRYRLCIVTRFGDRWVSPVVTVVIGPDDLRRAPPTEADFE